MITTNHSKASVADNTANTTESVSGTADGPTYWTTLCRTANSLERNVRISTDHTGRIAAISAGTPRQPGDIALNGLTIPGPANCHSHTFHRALRGLGAEGDTFWSWRNTMYTIASRLTPELYYQYAKAVYTEMVLAGYTTVAEFHYVHHQPSGQPYADPNAMGKALIAAAGEAGIRLTLLETCYLHADVKGSPLGPQQQRFSDGSVDRWLERVRSLDDSLNAEQRETAIIGAAAHSVRACSPRDAAAVAQWSRSGSVDRPLHVHLSEQTAENEACREHAGMTPTALLEQAGFWGPNAVAVHATHLDPADVETLARTGSMVALCPTTEADLADGIGPAAALHDSGIPLCIGSDENVSIDPFEEIRQLDAHERLASGKRDTFSCEHLIDMMTVNGQRACGWRDAGEIRRGALADFVTLDISDSPRTAGANPESVPLVATGADVKDVVVGGRMMVRNGVHRNGSPARSIAELTRLLRK